MMLFLEAIAHEEGFYKEGSRPWRNLNPGDLIYANESIRFGAIKSDGHFAVFSDIHAGWNALRRWLTIPATFVSHEIVKYYFDPYHKTTLTSGYLGASIAQVIYRFAPPDDGNDTEGYIKYVCDNTGLKRTDILTVEMLTVPNVTGTTE